MITDELEKIIIVEGLTDKKQIRKVITDDVTIICTNGTLGVERFDQMLEDYALDDKDVYILVDEDESGQKLRKQLARELPHAEHIYVSSEYREVATTPENILAQVLVSKRIAVNPIFLI
ncbi:MAG: toprim domain-containing protein [Bacillota bacterium]|uniref:Toprim domain-containing protein n=1 Tax=Virgibacillus salarius TaxID=447199 RepID=A0A941DS91_9BACI|nr:MULTISPECIES: toprim domain-containing protein [Bacillaceae]NAZ07195.1 toprim domain-containing protein [Agaribacter marinus]MBR7794472.1 toprim domain-containing protein [Virgibacillus salarius]MCC2248806.1 toprim domain-containing protein [Virgibacillus sp. AGTR]MDY7043266.1 toprim domain-containing protein [Virgibacillus sp. M23]QRZ17905.1 toprim domain-containing protein [Virgibacillus sp. AGTR]